MATYRRRTYGSHPALDGSVQYGELLDHHQPHFWSPNPSAETAEYDYNSSTLAYNSSTLNYSGVVALDMADSEKTPAYWDEVDT